MRSHTGATQSNWFEDPKTGRTARAWLIGFSYWLAFLLALEPGNILGSMGRPAAGHEILRICAAALLGSSITPLVLAAVRRFPIEGKRAWRNAAIQFLGSLAVSAGLMVVSCILAAVLFGAQRPFASALQREFQFNWMLVTFCTLTFVGFCHIHFAQGLFGIQPSRGTNPPAPTSMYLSTIPVRVRNELVQVHLGNIDWIEAQGNYLALHEGSRSFLIRDSLGNIAEKLDPKSFIRVHRGAIVSLASVEGISPLGSGDGRLRLKQGAQVRLSRKYRTAFLNAWQR